MRISTQMGQRQSVNQMMEQQEKIARTQNQLATGKKILAPSDDPTGSARALVLEREISRTEQFTRNGNSAELKLSREDTVLGNITNVLQNTRELAVQGLNDTYSPEQRQMLANEAIQNFHSLMSLLNSQGENGDYIFGGMANDQPPFVYQDPATNEGIEPFSSADLGLGSNNFEYAGDSGQAILQLGDSISVAINNPGNAIFTDIAISTGGTQDLLQTLYQFGHDLQNNTMDKDVLTNLDNAMLKIDSTRSQVGTRLAAVETEHESNLDYKLFVQSNLSEITDVDMAQAITEFNMQLTVMQAIQQTYTKTSSLSLFNYL
jgi:flagellar hook-associated protein 3 FlgL